VIEGIGADRVIFGSSAPLTDARLEILRARLAHVAEEAKRHALGENLLTLLAAA